MATKNSTRVQNASIDFPVTAGRVGRLLVKLGPAAAAFVLAGCSSSNPAPAAKVGDALNLTGPSGQKIAMVVQTVTDNALPFNSHAPAAGNRWVSVYYLLVNNSPDDYTDNPASARLLDTRGQAHAPVEMSADDLLLASDHVSYGDPGPGVIPKLESALEVLYFQLPVGVQYSTVELFTGTGPNSTGKWQAR